MTTKYLTKDLKIEIDKHEDRIVVLEKNDIRQDERIGELRQDVNAVCKTTKEMQKVLIASNLAIKVGTFIVTGFGVSVIALIWALITGQAVLQFN